MDRLPTFLNECVTLSINTVPTSLLLSVSCSIARHRELSFVVVKAHIHEWEARASLVKVDDAWMELGSDACTVFMIAPPLPKQVQERTLVHLL